MAKRRYGCGCGEPPFYSQLALDEHRRLRHMAATIGSTAGRKPTLDEIDAAEGARVAEKIADGRTEERTPTLPHRRMAGFGGFSQVAAMPGETLAYRSAPPPVVVARSFGVDRPEVMAATQRTAATAAKERTMGYHAGTYERTAETRAKASAAMKHYWATQSAASRTARAAAMSKAALRRHKRETTATANGHIVGQTLTTRQTAALLSCTRANVNRLIHDGSLKAKVISGTKRQTHLISLASALAYLSSPAKAKGRKAFDRRQNAETLVVTVGRRRNGHGTQRSLQITLPLPEALTKMTVRTFARSIVDQFSKAHGVRGSVRPVHVRNGR